MYNYVIWLFKKLYFSLYNNYIIMMTSIVTGGGSLLFQKREENFSPIGGVVIRLEKFMRSKFEII